MKTSICSHRFKIGFCKHLLRLHHLTLLEFAFWRCTLGCWATFRVLTEIRQPRTSSSVKLYAIWKMGCLDEKTFSFFCLAMLIRDITMRSLGKWLHFSIAVSSRIIRRVAFV